MRHSHFRTFLVLLVLLVTAASTATAQSLAWNPNTESNLAGYKVFIGTAPGTYGPGINVGNVTTYTPQGVDWTRRQYFAVKAYNTSGVESPFSNEAVWTPPSITTVTSITANLPGPYAPGTAVTWTAVGSNNLGPVEYKFYIAKLGTNWVLGRDWSTTNTFTWTPQAADAGAGNVVQVWARAVGSTAAYEAYLGTPAFTITGASITRVTGLTANVAYPLNSGSPATWTATATNNFNNPIEYKFYIAKLGTNWVLGRDWSTNPAFTWTPLAADAGANNIVQVWARTVGSTATYESYLGTVPFTINGPSTSTLTNITVNVPYPLTVGSAATWTATATNNFNNPIEYKFYIAKLGTNWMLLRDWSTTNTLTWTPQSGDVGSPNYIQVWARTVGSTSTYESYLGTPAFAINAAPLTLTSNVDFPTPPGNQVTWTAMLGSAPSGAVEYKFQVVDVSTNTTTLLRDYSSSNKVQWAPQAAGQFVVQALERAVGSPAAFDVMTASPTLTVGSSAISLSSVTASTSFPSTQGKPITFTARVKGGTSGPIQYSFWLYSVTNGWSNGQPWGPSETFTWTPKWTDTGDFAVQVWVRANGSAAAYEAYLGTNIFTINAAPLKLTSSTLFPAASGTQTSWSADVPPASPAMEYRFSVFTASTNTWSVVQAYSVQKNFVWQAPTLGTYAVRAESRQVGSSVAFEQQLSSSNFDITSGPALMVSLTPDKLVPATAGTTIAWKAGAIGGTTPVEYEFWRRDGATWTKVQDYSASNTYTWVTTAGDVGQHEVRARVRSVGSASPFEGQMVTGSFQVQ